MVGKYATHPAFQETSKLLSGLSMTIFIPTDNIGKFQLAHVFGGF